MERELIAAYRATIEAVLPKLTTENLEQATALASLPEHIRGFGHVKLENLKAVRAQWQELQHAITGNRSDATLPRLAA